MKNNLYHLSLFFSFLFYSFSSRRLKRGGLRLFRFSRGRDKEERGRRQEQKEGSDTEKRSERRGEVRLTEDQR